MKTKVLIPSDICEVGKQYLRDRGYEIKLGHGVQEDDIISDAQGCGAILVRNESITRKVLENIPTVKVISKHGVGVDKIDLKAAAEQNIWVTNAPLSNAMAVAEHTILLLLACAKKLVCFDLAVRSGDFKIRNMMRGMDLTGKTIGIVGCGNAGELVAKKCVYGFNMRALGYDPHRSKTVRIREIEYVNSLEELFVQSDFISLHVTGTKENDGLIGNRQLSLMKPTAVLINTSYGLAIDESALYETLREGKIVGAGLDVFAQEPPLLQNPLFTLPNIVVTPHVASLTYETAERMCLHAAEGIDAVLSGKEPAWVCVRPQCPRMPCASVYCGS